MEISVLLTRGGGPSNGHGTGWKLKTSHLGRIKKSWCVYKR